MVKDGSYFLSITICIDILILQKGLGFLIIAFLFILEKIYSKFPESPLQKIPIVCC